MRFLFSIFAALTFTLAATSAVFADDNLDAPDTLQKNQGPGGLDATAPVLKKHPMPTPSPAPQIKTPVKKSSGY